MDHLNFFKDLFESIPDYRKIVSLLFLAKKDDESLFQCFFEKW